MNTGDECGIKALQQKVIPDANPRVYRLIKISALKTYESQIRVYARQLEHAIESHSGRGIVVNDFFYWFSFDVMGQFAFSKSFDMLQTQQWHYSIQMLRKAFAHVGPFAPVPWLVRIMFDIPVLQIVRDFQTMVRWCAERMDERIEVTAELKNLTPQDES